MGLAPLVRGMSRSWLIAVFAGCGSEDFPQHACEDLARQAAIERSVVLARAERACTTVQDCVVVAPGLACHDDCDQTRAAVSLAAEPKLRANVRSIDANVCGEFLDRGCRPEVGGCDADDPPVLACRSGVCELEPASPK